MYFDLGAFIPSHLFLKSKSLLVASRTSFFLSSCLLFLYSFESFVNSSRFLYFLAFPLSPIILSVLSESCDFLNLSLGFSFANVLVPVFNHSLMLSVVLSVSAWLVLIFSYSVHFLYLLLCFPIVEMPLGFVLNIPITG